MPLVLLNNFDPEIVTLSLAGEPNTGYPLHAESDMGQGGSWINVLNEYTLITNADGLACMQFGSGYGTGTTYTMRLTVEDPVEGEQQWTVQVRQQPLPDPE